MSDVVKATVGVKHHGVRLGQVAERREVNGESCFPWPLPNRQPWVKEWCSDSADRQTVEHDLNAVSRPMHHKSGGTSDSLENWLRMGW